MKRELTENEVLLRIVEWQKKQIANLLSEKIELSKRIEERTDRANRYWQLACQFRAKWLDLCAAIKDARSSINSLHNKVNIIHDINMWDGYEIETRMGDMKKSEAQKTRGEV